MDRCLPGSSVHGILQARILEWVAMPSSWASSLPRNLHLLRYTYCWLNLLNLNNNNSNQFLSTFYVPITILNTSCASPRILLLQFFEAVTILIYVFVCKECFNNTMQTGCFNKKKSVSQGSGGWDQGVSRAGPLVFISIILISAFIFTWYSPFVFSLFLCPNFPFLIRFLVVLD